MLFRRDLLDWVSGAQYRTNQREYGSSGRRTPRREYGSTQHRTNPHHEPEEHLIFLDQGPPRQQTHRRRSSPEHRHQQRSDHAPSSSHRHYHGRRYPSVSDHPPSWVDRDAIDRLGASRQGRRRQRMPSSLSDHHLRFPSRSDHPPSWVDRDAIDNLQRGRRLHSNQRSRSHSVGGPAWALDQARQAISRHGLGGYHSSQWEDCTYHSPRSRSASQRSVHRQPSTSSSSSRNRRIGNWLGSVRSGSPQYSSDHRYSDNSANQFRHGVPPLFSGRR